ncbi:MAG: tRNA (adenosine(37)-N6)-threonylcarbamoyltransferase complex dimerization subunit type 1 TsaB [Candidatus Omnitrophica bacterium]|nr:tRNA (adenosine(37)-N6)-threonylcarbamoyltransferase complex dimerization subunit type 1 TsaB [Candidatus Omnitrophota bacterium]
MKLLLLDTSSRYLSLAVSKDEKVLYSTNRILDRKRSAKLVSLIDNSLKKAQLSLEEIDGFCVGQGPGSFTGLRIGITAIKGLAYILGKPVIAIPSLDILAQNFAYAKKDCSFSICPIVDAKQKKVYSCIYRLKDDKIKRKSPYLLLPLDDLLKRLQGETVFLGDAVKLYRQKISQAEKIRPIFAKENYWYPRMGAMVPLTLERLQKNDFKDQRSLEPLYLYPKECQIKRSS